MTPELEVLVAETLTDFETRVARGETPSVEEYAARLGDAYPHFLDLVRSEQAHAETPRPTSGGVLPRPFGPYTLRKLLGRGGAGTVYQAYHNRLGRLEAVKLLHAGAAADEVALQRFAREAVSAGRLTHPHILQIYGAGEVEGQPFLAMELVQGKSIDAWVREGHLPTRADLFLRTAEIADALGALHDVGIVHRDVKPSNILARTDGTVLLADFGLARTDIGPTITETDQILGSPRYMAPEQVTDAKHVDARADVYGLGATLYALLTGQPPLDAPEVVTLFKRLLHDRPKRPSQLEPALTADVDRVLLKCLEKRPADRYQTAADLAADLRALARGSMVAGRPVRGAVRAARWTRRRAIPLIAGATVLTALGAWHFSREAEVDFDAYIKADLFINGKLWPYPTKHGVPTPLVLPPGETTFTVKHGILETSTPMRRDLARGRNDKVQVAWVPQAQDDRAATKLISEIGVFRKRDYQRESSRGHPEGDYAALVPSGKVRLADVGLGMFEYPLLHEYKAGQLLRFVREGDPTTYTVPVPKNLALRFKLPPALRAKLKVGDRVTWGYVRDGTRNRKPKGTTTFHVVKDERVTSERQAFLIKNQPDWSRVYLLGKQLAEAQLYTAVVQLADTSVPLDLSKPLWEQHAGIKWTRSITPWIVALDALHRLGHDRSALVTLVDGRIEDFPKSVRKAWFAEY